MTTAAQGYILAVSAIDQAAAIAVDKPVASTAYAVANLISKQPSITWRSASEVVQTLSGDLLAAQKIDTFVLWNHNLTAASDVTLTLYNGATQVYQATFGGQASFYGWGEQPWDVGPWGGYLVSNTAPYAIHSFASVVADSWTLEISDLGNGDGYIEAGRIMLGLAWQPAANFEWGLSVGWEDPSDLEEYEDQSIGVVDELTPYRVGQIRWNWLEDTEGHDFNEILRAIGRKNTVLINPYPNETTAIAVSSRVLVRLVKWGQPSRQRTGYWSVACSFREAL